MKLELGILAGPETKGFLVDLTKQIDRLEKVTAQALSLLSKRDAEKEVETSEDEEDFASLLRLKV